MRLKDIKTSVSKDIAKKYKVEHKLVREKLNELLSEFNKREFFKNTFLTDQKNYMSIVLLYIVENKELNFTGIIDLCKETIKGMSWDGK